MADPASFAIGAFGVVCELYRLSMATYNLYVDIKNFSPAFKNIRLALNIERERLKLWAQCMGIDPELGINERLREHPELLELIREILTNMNDAFHDSAKMLDEYQEAHVQSHAQEGDDKPDIQRRTASSANAKRVLQNYGRILKWAGHDKKKLEHLIQDLIKYNNSLYKLASTTEEISLRRRLRTYFVVPTKVEDLQLVQETAAMMGHDDLEREANSKAFVQEVYKHEDLCAKLETVKLKAIVQSDRSLPEAINSWKFDFDEFQYKGVALMANHSHTLATYTYSNGEKEPVLIDWSRCADDSWRRHNREAFEIRLNNLARVLNRDLLPHGFHILQCLGYVLASSTTIGFIFRPPANILPDTTPVSLHDLLSNVKSPTDIPELGTRFALAKAVTTTLYEFHNIGWLHKNIQPGNIIFFYTEMTPNGIPTLDLRKPYLVGFDLSRSNQPGQVTEKPIASEGEDLYRHPNYKGKDATGFKPAYDYFSLGIVLFEIALWKLVSNTSTRDSEASRRTSGSDGRVGSGSVVSEPPRRSSGPGGTIEASRRTSGAAGVFGASRSASTPDAGHRPSLSSTDPDFISKTIRSKATDLGRFVGARYRDAALACISMELDGVWEDELESGKSVGKGEEAKEEEEREKSEESKERGKELALQEAVQRRVVDGVECCQA